ncbi:MAG: DEAD/DEAH box helicase [Adlercreutzia equolifaciens]
MNIASVIVDIPTQALDTPYSYAVPDEMLVGEGGRPAAVGCAVLVTLGGRKAVGYIVGLEEVVSSPDEGTDLWGTPQSAADLKQVEAVLGAVFRRGGAACALWLAERYAAPLSECARLFTPPRAVPRIVRGRDGRWRVEEPAIGGSGRPLGHARAGLRRVRSPQERREAAGGAGCGGRRRRARGRAVAGVRRRGFHVEGAGRQAGLSRWSGARRMRGMEDGASRAGAPAGGAAAPAPTAAPQLTEGQQAAVAAIEAARAAGDGRVVLVDGVTGSGKTEVYPQAIERTLAEGRRAIVLVPEISLTPQTVARFRGRFGDAVAVMHSRMSDGERYDQWDFISSGAAKSSWAPAARCSRRPPMWGSSSSTRSTRAPTSRTPRRATAHATWPSG